MNFPILFSIVWILLGAGFAWWLIGFIPSAGPFKEIAKGIIIFIAVVWVLSILAKAFRWV